MWVVKGLFAGHPPSFFACRALSVAVGEEEHLAVRFGGQTGYGRTWVAGQKGAQAVGEGIVLDVWDAEQSLGGRLDITDHEP